MKNDGYDLTRRAAGAFQGQSYEQEAEMSGRITIRNSTEADRAELLRLAELDSRPAVVGDALLGFVDGELRAALALGSGHAVADPFHPTAELVELLRVSAGRQNGASRLRGWRAFRHAAEAA